MGPDTPLDRVLSPKTARPFEDSLGIRTVGDLLRHYPRTYAERGQLTPLRELVVGEHVTISAQVVSSQYRQTRNGKYLVEIVVTDGSGRITLTFFYGNAGPARWRAEQHPAGSEGLFAGVVDLYTPRGGGPAKIQLAHPDTSADNRDLKPGELLPLYRATAKLPTWNIEKALKVVLDTVELPADPLPGVLREQHGLLPYQAALQGIHRPEGWAHVQACRTRLKWDEALVLQVFLAQRRREIQAIGGTPRPGRAEGLRDAFDAALPFALTGGQLEVGAVLDEELAQPHPMHRLLQGEVGSGKTVVALRAMLQVVDGGGQAALLAPTEVLAQQHLRSLRAMLGPLATAGELGSPDVATRLALLTGSASAAARRTALDEIRSGEAGIVVGTHALLSEGVEFHDLGLVVVDEQHRFGVEQRDLLRAKGGAPHTLVMTATPIPRTIAVTVYGDLETSTLRELPAGRSPLTTHVVGMQTPHYARAWERLREEVATGRQAFVVCPRIGGDDKEEPLEDDKRPSVAVLDLLPELAHGPLSQLRVEALHGRMTPEAKEDVMGRFAAGDLDVLVATTVIEVGVDVPNATVMVVVDADRFGISQLHQLRGRVGRGGHAGLCLLVTEAERESPAGERLAAVAATTDGFELARVDLELRREGDVLGTDQSGARSSLRLLQVLRDEELILEAREEAGTLVAADPDLSAHPAMRAAVAVLLDAERAAYLEKA
ncbi:MAG TPA: ATP-dependent DNA helicase RecG [Mycobacteriales bacterium]|nr:ATP-dependent DNA helicase RecG [Mycobacteriales bacterium]